VRVKQRHGAPASKEGLGPVTAFTATAIIFPSAASKEHFLAVAAPARRLAGPRAKWSTRPRWAETPAHRWVDGSYLLFVEPRLIGNLDVVSVRVADVCREVVGTPFGPKARFLV